MILRFRKMEEENRRLREENEALRQELARKSSRLEKQWENFLKYDGTIQGENLDED